MRALFGLFLPLSVVGEYWITPDAAGHVEIPAGTISIGSDAFSGCSLLTSVSFPSSLQDIGYAAFWATAITSIDLYATSVTSIRQMAFSDCDSLTSVSFPSSLQDIGDDQYGRDRHGAFESTAITSLDLSPPPSRASESRHSQIAPRSPR